MNEEIKNNFNKLLEKVQRISLTLDEKVKMDTARLDFCDQMLKRGVLTDDEDIGWCYWNISDSLALLRNAQMLFGNHAQFYNFVNEMPDQYAYWVVSDATQRGVLESGGHGDFWWTAYREANERNRIIGDHNANIAYTSHRAAMTVLPKIDVDIRKIGMARKNFEHLIDNTKNSDQSNFYRIIYGSCILNLYGSCEKDLFELCAYFYPFLSYPNEKNSFLLGEYKQLNAPCCPHKQAFVGITASINALINTKKQKMAKEIYTTAMQYGLPKNNYIEKRIND